MKSSKEFRALARYRLTGKWGISVLVTFVASLLGGSGGDGGVGSGVRTLAGDAAEVTGQISPELEGILANPVLFTALAGVLAAGAAIGLALFIIGGAVELGHSRYYIGLMGGEAPAFGVLFSRFQIFFKALGLRLYTALFVLLWSLLLFVPGIIAAYRYAMAPYLMAQYPEKGVVECVQDSKALMDGHKGRLFLLHLSFIGWGLLSLLTFGIGALWLTPYMQAAEAGFYLERIGQLPDPFREDGGYNPQPQA